MSQENVEIVRNAFDAFTEGDMDGVLRLCDEDIVVTQPPDLPGAPAEQRGHGGVLEAFAFWPEQWDDFRVKILRIVADPGDFVIVTVRTSGRGKQSGAEVDTTFTFVFIIRDEKIVEWQLFMSEEQALEAAGLRE
jgi:ketosteroid isomerase-like protein